MKKHLLIIAFFLVLIISNAQNNAFEITADGTWGLVEEIPAVVEELTIEAWVYFDPDVVVDDYTAIVDFRGGSATMALVFRPNLDGNLSLGFEWGGQWDYQAESYEVLKGEWQHVALVVSSETNSGHLFVNGVEEDSYDAYDMLGEEVTLGGTLRIGGGNNQAERTIIGKMDEIRIWEVARTEEEIEANMLNPVETDASDLLIYYNFDEDVDALTDITGNGYDAIFTATDFQFVESDIDGWNETNSSDLLKENFNSTTLFPNPVQDILNIKGINLTNSEINIYNLSGKLVGKTIGNSSAIQVGNLQKGIYFIEAITATNQFNGKFIKE